jgi:hypothetical protein
LERPPITSSVTGGDGVARTRAQYSFPAQPIATSITAVLTAAIAAGVPLAIGTIEACYDAPPITIQTDTFAGALTQLCGLVADCMLWFDYSGTTPVINLTRRASAPARTLDGRDLNPGWEMTPLPERLQERIVIAYADRQTDGRTIFKEQTSGTATVTGRTQIYTVSGPEVGAAVPDTAVESYVSYAVAANAANVFTMAKVALGFGSVDHSSWGDVFACGDTTVIQGRLPTAAAPLTTQYTTAPMKFLTDGGLVVPFAGYYISRVSPPAWVSSVASVIAVQVSAELYFQWFQYGYSGGVVTYNGSLPSWFNLAEWSNVKTYHLTTGPTSDGLYQLFTRIVTFPVWLLSTATSPLYQPFEYDFTQPPAGMAAGLLSTVDHMPWQGSLSWDDAEAGGTRFRGTKVAVSNAMTSLATAEALVREEDIDIDLGRTSVRLGAAPQFDMRQFPDRINRKASDNLVIH